MTHAQIKGAAMHVAALIGGLRVRDWSLARSRPIAIIRIADDDRPTASNDGGDARGSVVGSSLLVSVFNHES